MPNIEKGLKNINFMTPEQYNAVAQKDSAELYFIEQKIQVPGVGVTVFPNGLIHQEIILEDTCQNLIASGKMWQWPSSNVVVFAGDVTLPIAFPNKCLDIHVENLSYEFRLNKTDTVPEFRKWYDNNTGDANGWIRHFLYSTITPKPQSNQEFRVRASSLFHANYDERFKIRIRAWGY